MGKKRFKAEQIIRMLREADVEVAKGQSIAHVCRKLEGWGRNYCKDMMNIEQDITIQNK
ncbi:MAG TPA: hypothetical protein QF468_14140 [Nitrospinota bacterium]|jgi:hypothetical protein|nr:hypothetical protein [Nitrospinota bacterium]